MGVKGKVKNAKELNEVLRDPIALLLKSTSQYPLLKADEEIELAKRVERGDQEQKHQRGAIDRGADDGPGAFDLRRAESVP